ncbi:MAG: 4Fe-4S dicluster domain-containing protein [Candidatus Bathyarchaeia archaeon]|nr:4Fe-4S dicluster domain-containing protein [Candidatus Bathyarchaeota archaeon]
MDDTSEQRKQGQNNLKTGKIDPKFKYEIMRMPGSEKVHLCFQCGTCTADCVIARFTDFYRPRKIARTIQLGLKERLIGNEALWLCTTCHTCIDHCPQGVEVSSIIRALRNISVKNLGAMPSIYKIFASNILKSGYVYLMPESRLKKREEQGLPPLPKPNLNDVAKLFHATGFNETLEKAKTMENAKAEGAN